MMRSWIMISLVAVLSLTCSVIWLDTGMAAQVPRLEKLGQLKAGLRVPTRLDVDAAGNLYVADTRAQRVVKFDKFGHLVRSYDQVKISGAGLAVSTSGQRIYVSSCDKVAILGGSGELLGYFGRGAGEFIAAGSIDLDSDGNIYVADLRARKIKIYDPQGNYSGSLGIASFVANSSMHIDQRTDLIYVSDSASSQTAGLIPKISVYDRTGKLLRSINAEGDFGAPLHFFGGMTFDALGRFYIGDTQGMNIRVLDSGDQPLLSYDNQGQVYRPSAMAYDASTSRLYVVQSDQQVAIYGVDGGQMPIRANSAPQVPLPISPIAGSQVPSATPTLQFNNASDPDPQDELTYTLRIFDTAERVVATMNVVEQAQQTAAQLSTPLRENHSYTWQVQAFDGLEVSPWSEPQTFCVNAVAEAPEGPQLLTPLAGAGVHSNALFSWQGAADSDPVDLLRYRIEVAEDAEFSNPVFSQELTETLLPLADWSPLLEPGQDYSWRVTAIDKQGLQAVSDEDGRFRYQASALVVSANIPGARVYLAGNHNYSGQYLGDAPLELRDLPVGRYQLVVERAGFESYLQPVDILADRRSEVTAQLRPAKIPAELTFNALQVAGQPIHSGSLITAQLADLNLDGVEDLLLALSDGALHFYPGQLDDQRSQRQLVFAAGQPLSLPQLIGASICLADWNNDYRQDLLVGTADGSVQLFLNQGDFSFNANGHWLAAVNGAAVPAVADLDGDGHKDLVIGSGDGELVLLRNLGTDAQPQLASAQLLISFAAAAAPSFSDWDADGRPELLIATDGEVYRARYQAGALSNLSLVVSSGAAVARVQALDLNGAGGKDLLATTADGRLLLATANGLDYVDSFYPALNEKQLQLRALVADEYPIGLALLDRLAASLTRRQLTDALQLCEELLSGLPVGSGAAVVTAELATLLQN